MSNMSRPLVITGDAKVLDDILSVSAAAGVEPEVAPDVGTGRRSWLTASAIVLGSDALTDSLLTAGLPRRDAIVVVSPRPPEASLLQKAIQFGAESVVVLPGDEGALVDRLADVLEGDGRAGFVACVIGATGGAGATLLSTSLALAASWRGTPTLLVDADQYGGGLDVAIGVEERPGLRWPDLREASGRISAAALRAELPALGQLALLSMAADRCELTEKAVQAVLTASRRAGEFVVVDAQRSLTPPTLAAINSSDVVLLVTPSSIRGLAAAKSMTQELSGQACDIRVVPRRVRKGWLPSKHISKALSLPLAGELPWRPRLAAAFDEGKVITTPHKLFLGAFSRRLLDGLLASTAWSHYAAA